MSITYTATLSSEGLEISFEKTDMLGRFVSSSGQGWRIVPLPQGWRTMVVVDDALAAAGWKRVSEWNRSAGNRFKSVVDKP